MYGPKFQGALSEWRRLIVLTEHVHLRTLNPSLTLAELQDRHDVAPHDARLLLDEVLATWADRGKDTVTDRRDAMRARLGYLWECAVQRPVKDKDGCPVVKADGTILLDPDLREAREILRDMRQLDALDVPARVSVDVQHTVTTTSTRERVLTLLAKARGQLPASSGDEITPPTNGNATRVVASSGKRSPAPYEVIDVEAEDEDVA